MHLGLEAARGAEAQLLHRVGGQSATPVSARVGALHMHTYPSLGVGSSLEEPPPVPRRRRVMYMPVDIG